MDILICPVCRGELLDKGCFMRCGKGHSFDRSADGYVNLLMGNKNGNSVGDNKAMARARHDFLEKGYYSCLRDALKEKFASLFPKGGRVCDAGCGEGYYMSALTSLSNAELWGFDISKNMLRLAGKRRNGVHLFVAGVNSIPAADKCFDGLLSVFAPICASEFARILKDDGVLVCATAGKKHLWELKEVLYQRPYENDEEFAVPDGFKVTEVARVSARIKLDSQEDIEALFAMTPYYYRTPASGREKLKKLSELETELDFVVRVLKKN